MTTGSRRLNVQAPAFYSDSDHHRIIFHIKQVSQDVLNVEEGSLYPALHRMEEAGLIKARWVTTENNRRARVYEITRAGAKELEQEEIRWRAISSAIGRVLKEA